jgi:hypothetical protein
MMRHKWQEQLSSLDRLTAVYQRYAFANCRDYAIHRQHCAEDLS